MKKTINKEVWIDDEVFTVEARVTWTVDNDYGADADGNRGESRLFIDDVEILSVQDEEGYFIDRPNLKEIISDRIDVSSDDLIE